MTAAVVTWHAHASVFDAGVVHRDCPWWRFRERTYEDVAAAKAGGADVHGMRVMVDGCTVAYVDHDGEIDFVWPSTFESGGAVTVGQIAEAVRTR